MPSEAFNQPILLRPACYPLTAQGGANPMPAGGYAYLGSVQPMRDSYQDQRVGTQAAIPQSTTKFDVLLAWADDPVIRAIQYGDEVDWGDLQMTALAPAKDSGGLGTVWRISCELVVS